MSDQPFRPERQTFLVHVSGTEEYGVLPEWWGALDSATESRSLRFSDDGATWLGEGELPSQLKAAGSRLTEVTGVSESAGLTHPSLAVGRRVLLQPEPADPGASPAVTVWLDDVSELVGYLPSELAAEIMHEADARGVGFGAFVAAEERDAASHERRGLRLILGPGVVWAKEIG